MEVKWERAGGKGEGGASVLSLKHFHHPPPPKAVSHIIPRGSVGEVIRVSPGCSPLPHSFLRVCGFHPHLRNPKEALGQV